MDTSIIEQLENLNLSEKKMDTSMALEFIKKINVFDKWPIKDESFRFKYPNELTQCSSDEVFHCCDPLARLSVDPVQATRKLAKKIEENAEMFVQLEYLARGTDSRDVRDGHIKLMSQLLRCTDALWNNATWDLYVTEGMPLYNLASVVAFLNRDIEANDVPPKRIYVVDEKIKYLCHFFVQLCHDVGLCVPLIYVHEDREKYGKFLVWQEHLAENTGCTGVIAEYSDLDSAIDAFVYSSVTAPWRLKQIYVQESVFIDFKNAFAAKARACFDSRDCIVGGKTFLMEPLLASDTGIRVHAYRTTKELLSLLQTPYLSVWAADSALANEVALNAPAYTIWLNDYGSFEGPPRAALSVYNLYIKTIMYEINMEEILKPWAKMQATERLEVIIAVIEASEIKNVRELLPYLRKGRSDDFIHVTDKTVCFGIQQQMGLLVISLIRSDLLPTIRVLVNGNGVICGLVGEFRQFVDELYKNGVPIAESKVEDKFVSQRIPIVMERLKVVRTNYGTIFAN